MSQSLCINRGVRVCWLGHLSFGEELTASAFWTGQIRPVCDLVAHMVKLRAVAITLLTTATFYDRIQNELKRNFNADDVHRMLYIRYSGLPTYGVYRHLLTTGASMVES